MCEKHNSFNPWPQARPLRFGHVLTFGYGLNTGIISSQRWAKPLSWWRGIQENMESFKRLAAPLSLKKMRAPCSRHVEKNSISTAHGKAPEE